MPQAEYTTTINLTNEDDAEVDVDVEITYDWDAYQPAILYGPAAGPAEGGNVEITKVILLLTKEDITSQLTDDELTALETEIIENCNPEAEEEAARADYLYDQRRDEHMESYYD